MKTAHPPIRRVLALLLLGASPLVVGQGIAWIPVSMEWVIPVMAVQLAALPTIAIVSWIAIVTTIVRSGVGPVMATALAVAAGLACALALVVGISQLLASKWTQFMP
jgi:hypothetical protein